LHCSGPVPPQHKTVLGASPINTVQQEHQWGDAARPGNL